LQQTSTGTLSMLLDNRSGDYSATNASGAYYPNVKRMRWIRVRAQWLGVTYARWQGLIETWDQTWPSFGKDATVEVRAADAMKVLNLFRIGSLSYPEQLSGERVAAVCGDVGIPVDADDGISTIIETASGTSSIETTALSHLQNVEETENGRLFVDGEGTVIFQDRHWRLNNATTSVGTIGDGTGEIPYRETALAYDESNIWNKVVITTADGEEEVAEDFDSQDEYFQRTLTRRLLTNDNAEALAAGEWLVRKYREPEPKLPALPLLPIKATTHWPVVLAATNGQRFTFKRRPESGGTISIDGYVEQVAETIVPGTTWDVSVQLSAAGDEAFWILGTSALDIDTALAY
jgi:hypothetical protein